MNILLLSPEYPPFSLGGVSVHASQLTDKLCSDVKNRVIVITMMNDVNKEDIDVEHRLNKTIVRVNIFGKIQNISNEEEQFALQNRLIRTGIDYLLKKRQLDDIQLITIHGNFLAEAAIYCKEVLKVPMIYHAHTTYSFEIIEEKGDISGSNIATYESLLCINSEHIVAVSEYLKDLISKYFNAPADKISVIGKGIDIEAYDRVTPSKCSGEYKILFVGRISNEKGLDVLLMALRLLTRKLSFVPRLYIVGSAINKEYLEKVKEMISQLALNKQVIFLGAKTQKEIIHEFKSSDLVVVPSYIETFGRVAIEAMAAKVSVIVSDAGGLGPLVENQITGLKFTSGNYVELMNCMYYAMEHPDVCDKMIQNAYSYVRSLYTIDMIFAQTEKLYEKIIDYS